MAKTSRRWVLNVPVKSPLKGLFIGDSIVDSIYTGHSIPEYTITQSDLDSGSTYRSFAVAGADINNQRDAYASDPDKLLYDYIMMQIGINNVGGGGDYAGTRFQYQRFVNELRSTSKSGIKIYASLMTPANALLSTRGSAQQIWEQINADIAGTSSTPITGLDGVVTQHIGILGDSQFNLKPEFEIVGQNDHIHINDSAKQIIASLWENMIFTN